MINEIRLSGSGGQGIVFIGSIIAEAAVVYEGKNATQNSSYGGQVRGGTVCSDVLVAEADEEIAFPEVTAADILLAMSQEAANMFSKDVKNKGIIILDTTCVNEIPVARSTIYKFPITRIAEEKFKTSLVANMVSLGIIIELIRIVSKDAIEKAIRSISPKGTDNANREAFSFGCKTAQEYVQEAVK